MELIVLIIIAALVIYYLNNKPSDKEQISTSHLPDSFIVFDLETTGLDAKNEEIIEIGAIKFTKGFLNHQTFQVLIKSNRNIPKRCPGSAQLPADHWLARGCCLTQA